MRSIRSGKDGKERYLNQNQSFKKIMKKKKTKSALAELAIIAVVFFLIIIIVLVVVQESLRHIETMKTDLLEEIIEEKSTKIQNCLTHEKHTLEAIAHMIGESTMSLDDERLGTVLQELADISLPSSYRVIDKNGIILEYNGDIYTDVSNTSAYKEAMAGRYSIVYRSVAQGDLIPAIVLNVPIYRKEDIIGVLAARISYKKFNALMEHGATNRQGIDFFICNEDYEILNEVEHLEMAEAIVATLDEQTIIFKETITYKNIGDAGIFSFKMDGEKQHLTYQGIKDSKWYLLATISDDFLETQIALNTNIRISIFLLAIFVLFLIIILYIMYTQGRARESLENAHDELSVMYNVLPNAIFRYEPIKKRVSFANEGFYTFFECNKEQFKETYKNDILACIPKEYRHKIEEYFLLSMNSETIFSIECPMICYDNQIKWALFHSKFMNRRSGEGVYLTMIIDITTQRHLSTMDPLTQLNNRREFERQVNDYLMVPEGGAVFVLMDIDDFKNINDTLGHSYGDFALMTVADRIRESFCDSRYILGRYAGDEFYVFIKNVDEINEAIAIVNEFLEKFKKEICFNGVKHLLTMSVGVSTFPADGIEYDALFDHADHALYEGKHAGKNIIKVYD